MKASWKGTLQFGLMSIPVRLYNATKSLEPVFIQVHAADLSPVERQTICRAEQIPIHPAEVARAVEDASGTVIVLSEHELSRLSRDKAKQIELLQFCPPEEIDSLLYQKPYYVLPARGGEKAYAIFREALLQSKLVGVARFFLRQREHIAAISVRDGLIVLEQLRFAAELVSPAQLPRPSLEQPKPSEQSAATALMRQLSGHFYPQDYHNEYAQRLQKLIANKKRGLPAPHYEPPISVEQQAENLIKILRQSLEQQRRLKRRTANRQ